MDLVICKSPSAKKFGLRWAKFTWQMRYSMMKSNLVFPVEQELKA